MDFSHLTDEQLDAKIEELEKEVDYYSKAPGYTDWCVTSGWLDEARKERWARRYRIKDDDYYD